MAKAVVKPKPAPKKAVLYNPPDWLRGSKLLGKDYTAWDSYNQGRPDFGVGAGPGTPYHEIQKKITGGSPIQIPQSNAGPTPYQPQVNNQWKPPSDPRTEAIRRRLRGL